MRFQDTFPNPEALGGLSDARMSQIFPGVDFSAELEGSTERPTKSDLRTFRDISASFNRGGSASWDTWGQTIRNGGSSIEQWVGEIHNARAGIAQSANIEPVELHAQLNQLWANFGQTNTVACPNPIDFAHLDAEFAVKLAYPEYPMAITSGFGGTIDQTVSSRALGWVTPALSLARAFQQVGGTPPAVRIFSAHELSADVNGLDADITADVAARTQSAILLYTQQYFPDVVDYLQLTSSDYETIQANLDQLDIEQGVDNILQKLIKQYEQNDLRDIQHTAAGLLGAISLRDKVLGKSLQRLIEVGEKRGPGGKEGTARYIMAHTTPQVFGTYVDLEGDDSLMSVIKIGGPSEKVFTGAQRAIAELTPAKPGSIARTHFSDATEGPAQLHFVSKSDSLPPYYAPSAGRTINDMTLGPNGELTSFEGKPDADTLMAITAAGSKEALQDFMAQAGNS